MFSLGGAASVTAGQNGNPNDKVSNTVEMLCFHEDALSPCEVSGQGVNSILGQ